MLIALVVEDDYKSFRICERALVELGIANAFYAKSAEAAMEFLSEGHVDLVLLDILLPGRSGLELAHWMYKNRELRLAQIIFITGSEDDYELEAYRELHCFSYVKKPFTKKEIVNLLRPLVEALETKLENSLLMEGKEADEQGEALFFEQSGSIRRIRPDQVYYIEVSKGGCTVVNDQGSIWLEGVTLKEIALKLLHSGGTFERCHRLILVNTAKISGITRLSARKFMISFADISQLVEMSLTYKSKVIEKWKDEGK